MVSFVFLTPKIWNRTQAGSEIWVEMGSEPWAWNPRYEHGGQEPPMAKNMQKIEVRWVIFYK